MAGYALGLDNRFMTKVLVVDDEPIVRDVISRYLRREWFPDARGRDGRRGS
jgi:DNA-binding NtrC family response regulator